MHVDASGITLCRRFLYFPICISQRGACLIHGDVSPGRNPGYLIAAAVCRELQQVHGAVPRDAAYTTNERGANPFSDFLTLVVHTQYCSHRRARTHARELHFVPSFLSLESRVRKHVRSPSGRVARRGGYETESIEGRSRIIAVAGRRQLARPDTNRSLIRSLFPPRYWVMVWPESPTWSIVKQE